MNDREKWRERVRDIRATSTTWWWWWFIYFKYIILIYHYCYYHCYYIYIYIYIYYCKRYPQTIILLPAHKYHTTLKKKGNVMMILILIILIIIIIINKIPHETDISYSNQNKPLATVKLESKRKSDCNNQFPPPSPTLLFSHSLPLSHSFPSTDCGNRCKYVKMHASTYTNIRTYKAHINVISLIVSTI